MQARPYLQAGAFEIVDDSLKGSFDVESMRKAAMVAIRSVERDASRRPTIAQVLAELKEAYSLQLVYLASRDMWVDDVWSEILAQGFVLFWTKIQFSLMRIYKYTHTGTRTKRQLLYESTRSILLLLKNENVIYIPVYWCLFCSYNSNCAIESPYDSSSSTISVFLFLSPPLLGRTIMPILEK